MTDARLHNANPPLRSANYLWAGFFPLAYVGVMMLMRQEVRRFTFANYLDGVVATLTCAAAFAAFAFGAIQSAAGDDSVTVAWNLIYPVGDILLLVLTLGAAALVPAGRRTRWYLMAAASLFNAIGDICALFDNGICATHFGYFWNSIAWPASLFLFSLSVWVGSPRPAESELKETSSGFLIPGVAAGLALLILFVGSLNHINQMALGLATATLVAAGARFGLALMRLRELTEERHRQLADSAQIERDSREALQAAVRHYSEFAAKVADGDLRASVGADGSADLEGLSESLNSMVSGLAQISSHIQAGVHDMGGSTAEILESVSRHNESASQQSTAIAETSTTVDELRLAAKDTANMASKVAERASDSLQVSDEGGHDAVAAIANAMAEIRERVGRDTARDIVTLSERTQQIGEITADGQRPRGASPTCSRSTPASRPPAPASTARASRRAPRRSAASPSSPRRRPRRSRDARRVQTATSAAVAASKEGTKVVEQGLELTGRAGDGIRSLTRTRSRSSRRRGPGDRRFGSSAERRHRADRAGDGQRQRGHRPVPRRRAPVPAGRRDAQRARGPTRRGHRALPRLSGPSALTLDRAPARTTFLRLRMSGCAAAEPLPAAAGTAARSLGSQRRGALHVELDAGRNEHGDRPERVVDVELDHRPGEACLAEVEHDRAEQRPPRRPLGYLPGAAPDELRADRTMLRMGNQGRYGRMRRQVGGQLREVAIGAGELRAADAVAELLERQTTADHGVAEQHDATFSFVVTHADRRQVGPLVHHRDGRRPPRLATRRRGR